MMNVDEFKKQAHMAVEWMADYFANIEKYPVKSAVSPGEISAKLPLEPPAAGENFDDIMADFKNIIMPGITHWQHPSFFGYFPANSSYESVIAEMLTSALGAQCMSWITSPAATELEGRVMEWMGKIIGLPEGFCGVIQDSASSATLCSILTAREKYSDYRVNEKGIGAVPKYTVYCSEQAHSSIEKAVKIAGIGCENLRKIKVDERFALRPAELEAAITSDIASGMRPLCVVAAIGTTGSTAIDPLDEIGNICKKYNIWLHVDAAYAGSALVLPEMRYMIKGLEKADTFVFNPHKWLFTNFDCTAYFVKDKIALIKTFEILPEYLKTPEGERVNNYRDWGVQLGRRFRALKLWFVVRSYGIEGLGEKIKKHIEIAKKFEKTIRANSRFEVMAPVPLSTICFRFKPEGINDAEELNAINAGLLKAVNDTGRAFLTHTKLNGNYVIRLVVGQTYVEQKHVEDAWSLILKISQTLA